MNNQSQHQPPDVKSWSIYYEGEKDPAYIRADSIRLRDDGYTLVADGVQIPQMNHIVKVEIHHDK